MNRTGEKIPEIGLGTWGIGGATSADLTADEAFVAAIKNAIEAGMKLIDTAEMYGAGHTEELVGRAIKGYKRDEVFVISKVWHNHLRRDDLLDSARKSVQRLGTYMDLFLVHWPNPSVPLQETIRAMEEVAEQGLTRYIGVSNFSAELLDEARSSTSKYEIVADEVKYSITDRAAEKDVLPYCEKNSIALIAYTPIEHGKISEGPIGDALQKVAKKYSKTPVQVALNWLTYHEPVIAIPKASKKEHVIEDAGASDWRLSSEDFEFLTKARRIFCKTRKSALVHRASCSRRSWS
ncbi:MAG: aldo/keto reductase [Thermoprotei archaeon]